VSREVGTEGKLGVPCGIAAAWLARGGSDRQRELRWRDSSPRTGVATLSNFATAVANGALSKKITVD